MSVVRVHAAVFNAGDMKTVWRCFRDVAATDAILAYRTVLYMALYVQTAYDFHCQPT